MKHIISLVLAITLTFSFMHSHAGIEECPGYPIATLFTAECME